MGILLDMLHEANAEAVPPRSPCISEKKPELYASTDLCFRWLNPDSPTDVLLDEKKYRRISPEYFAWLSFQMFNAQQAFEAGKLPEAPWNTIKERFTNLNIEAVKRYGDSLKLDSRIHFNPCQYDHPKAKQKNISTPFSSWLFPSLIQANSDTLPFTEPVTKESVEKVNAIKDSAIALGWTEAQLLQNRGDYRFPCGENYGLVCFVNNPARTIGKITLQAIEIIHSENCSKPVIFFFFNNSVVQPWYKSTDVQ